MPDPVATDLEQIRGYLLTKARRKVPPHMRGKIDLSGVVQDTLFEAHRAGEKFAHLGSDAQMGWLVVCLDRNVKDELRKLDTAARDLDREEVPAEGSELAANQSTPSDRVAKKEQEERLAAALGELPEDQRQAFNLHLAGMKLAQIADSMGRSRESVAGLLFRGRQRLRDLLGEDFVRQ